MTTPSAIIHLSFFVNEKFDNRPSQIYPPNSMQYAPAAAPYPAVNSGLPRTLHGRHVSPDRELTATLASWLHYDGVLARHVTVDTATDLMWALASVQGLGSAHRGTPLAAERYRRELTTALERILV